MTPTDKAASLTAMQLLTQQIVAIRQGPTPPPDGVTSFLLPSKSTMKPKSRIGPLPALELTE